MPAPSHRLTVPASEFVVGGGRHVALVVPQPELHQSAELEGASEEEKEHACCTHLCVALRGLLAFMSMSVVGVDGGGDVRDDDDDTKVDDDERR